MVHSAPESSLTALFADADPLRSTKGHNNDDDVDGQQLQQQHANTANSFFVDSVKRLVEEVDRRSDNANGERLPEPPMEEEYPCIDISSWMNPNESTREEREKVTRFVAEQAAAAGSFNVVGHGVDQDLFDRLDFRSRQFFELSLEEKQKYARENHKCGYTAVKSESVSAVYGDDGVDDKETEKRDLREVYSAVYPRDSPVNVGPDFYREVVDEYIERMNKLDIVLHRILSAALATSKGISVPENLFNTAKGSSTEGCLRCSRYPKMDDDKYDDACKLKAHSDWGTLAVLYSESSGLEEIRDGRWIAVPVRRGELHVAIGETIAVWSNLRFKNNVHRVGRNAERDRISYAYFAAQGFGSCDTDEGIEPVCGPGEEPKFGKISTSAHVENYFKTYFS